MFCSKCGTQNPETSTFCGSCGAPLVKPETHEDAAEDYSVPQFAIQSQENSPRNRRTGIIACVIAAVIVIIGIICVMNIGNSPEKVTENYIKAMINIDIKKASKYSVIDIKKFFDIYFDKMEKDESKSLDDFLDVFDAKDVNDIWDKLAEENDERIIDKYGKNYKITVQIRDTDKLSDDEADEVIDKMKDILDDVDGNYDIPYKDYSSLNKVKDIYEVKFKILFKGDEDDGDTNGTLYVAKVGGRWKVLDAHSIHEFM